MDDAHLVALENHFVPPSSPEAIASYWGDRLPPGHVRSLWLDVDGIDLCYRVGMYGLRIFGTRDGRSATLGASDDVNELLESDIAGSSQGCGELLPYNPSDGWIASTGVETRDEWLRLGFGLNEFLAAFRDEGTEGPWRNSFVDAEGR